MYGMTEGGLFCSNHPKPNEIIGIDKEKAITSKIIQTLCENDSPLKVWHFCHFKFKDTCLDRQEKYLLIVN